MKYYVYVIGLKPEVMLEKKFREWNPQYREGKSCYYVGSSYLKPEERYKIHREKIPTKKGEKQYNKWVYKYHDGLRHGKYKNLPVYGGCRGGARLAPPAHRKGGTRAQEVQPRTPTRRGAWEARSQTDAVRGFARGAPL